MNENVEKKGLGWAFLDLLIKNEFKKASFEYKYQLQIEDAELICNYNTVIFVDASKNELIKGYNFYTCKSSNKHSFSTHALLPETILYLSEHLYDHKPKAYILEIQGYEWELKNGLTKTASENLKKAIEFFNQKTFLNHIKTEHDKSHKLK
jgi:Ni,Fe-hydrogenase maturation factor